MAWPCDGPPTGVVVGGNARIDEETQLSTNEGNERRLLEEAQQVVDRAYQRIKVDRQYRRLSKALRKLG